MALHAAGDPDFPGWANSVDAAVAANAAADALKAPIASPTFTGTVTGVTKAMVGLGSADNTTDALKPISTAQAAANATLTASLFVSQEAAPAHKVGLRWFKPSTKATSISDGTTWTSAQRSFVFGSTTPVAGVTVTFSGTFTTDASGITQAFNLAPYMTSVTAGFASTPNAGAGLLALPNGLTVGAYSFRVWNGAALVASQSFPGIAVFHGVV